MLYCELYEIFMCMLCYLYQILVKHNTLPLSLSLHTRARTHACYIYEIIKAISCAALEIRPFFYFFITFLSSLYDFI